MQMQINLAAIDSLSFSLFTGAAVEQDLRGRCRSLRRAPSTSPPHRRLACSKGPALRAALFLFPHNVAVSAHTLRGISWNSRLSVCLCVCV